MFIEKAYESRAALKDEADRYRYAIRNYPPDRMEKHGRPFLAQIEAKVIEVERLIAERSA